MTTSPPPQPASEDDMDLIWGAAIDSVFGARSSPVPSVSPAVEPPSAPIPKPRVPARKRTIIAI
jgi:hypothetical protein